MLQNHGEPERWRARGGPEMQESHEDATGPLSVGEGIDQEAAREICCRREFNGRRFQLGQFVAILGGRVVAVGATFDEVYSALLALEPDPRKGVICEVEEPVVDVIRPLA